METLVLRKMPVGSFTRFKFVCVGPKKLIGGGLLKLERVRVICPACGQQIEAVARNGHIKGYCAVAKQYVDFPIETQRVPIGKELTAETRAKVSVALKRRHSAERSAE